MRRTSFVHLEIYMQRPILSNKQKRQSLSEFMKFSASHLNDTNWISEFLVSPFLASWLLHSSNSSYMSTGEF